MGCTTSCLQKGHRESEVKGECLRILVSWKKVAMCEGIRSSDTISFQVWHVYVSWDVLQNTSVLFHPQTCWDSLLTKFLVLLLHRFHRGEALRRIATSECHNCAPQPIWPNHWRSAQVLPQEPTRRSPISAAVVTVDTLCILMPLRRTQWQRPAKIWTDVRNCWVEFLEKKVRLLIFLQFDRSLTPSRSHCCKTWSLLSFQMQGVVREVLTGKWKEKLLVWKKQAPKPGEIAVLLFQSFSLDVKHSWETCTCTRQHFQGLVAQTKREPGSTENNQKNLVFGHGKFDEVKRPCATSQQLR